MKVRDLRKTYLEVGGLLVVEDVTLPVVGGRVPERLVSERRTPLNG